MSLALGSSEAATKRFTREVQILKQLQHPNIVKYLGSGKYHGSPFYVMEYVQGESLDRILARRTRLPWEEVIELGILLCAALQHAHDKGIFHRDLKPSNLMILKDGTVKLTDFGIAKDADVTALTAANSTVGTAAYMSPEQCRGVRDITLKTDLYSMGIVFYELLTGRKPFTGETPMEVFLQHANKTDYKTPGQIVLEIPIWLDTLVCQLMEKEPAKRPINAAAVADALRLIKEKIEVQRSAGVDAATRRKIDRTTREKALDETDKTAAREMLGKKKKKQKAPAFYAKGWFTIVALTVLLGACGAGIYFAFLRTPSPDALYSEADTLLRTDAKAAREGPIALFLSAYPTHAKAPQVQKWADDYDFETRDRQMHNRRNHQDKFKADGPEEWLARAALDDEDAGNFTDAERRWRELSAKKGSADLDVRAWGLVGDRYLQELQKVDERYADLRKKAKTDAQPSDALERAALDAVRAEEENQLTTAKERWDSLKGNAKGPDRRQWYLLAVKRSAALKK
jgi:serine/threonine-protein kinase